MAAPVVSGTVALMLQANPALTPNAVKAILQYTAESYPGYDPLTQGAGFLNAQGAVELARVPCGSVERRRIRMPSGWGSRLIWGNRLARGGRLTADANAWSTRRHVGRARVRQRVVGVRCESARLHRHGAAHGASSTARHGTSSGDRLCGGSRLRAVPGRWSAHGADDGETVVWGTDDGETVVWGTRRRRNRRVGDRRRRNGRVGHGVHAIRVACPSSGAASDDVRSWPVAHRARGTSRARRAVVDRAADGGARLRRRPSSRRASLRASRGFRRAYPQPWLFVAAADHVLPDVGVEGQPADSARERLDAVGVVRGRSDGAAAARARPARLIIALAGVWTQCTVNVKQRYPLYRTIFSIAAEAITMAATGLVYQSLGGPLTPVDFSTSREAARRRDRDVLPRQHRPGRGGDRAPRGADASGTSGARTFSWSGASFMVAGTAGAVAAVVIARGEHWKAVLMIAPVYLTYRTYRVFIGRLEDRERHAAEAAGCTRRRSRRCRMARNAEQELAAEKERLAETRRRADAPRGRAPGAARARAGGAGERRGRQPAEGSVPRDGVARAADAAERDSRMGRHAADARRSTSRSARPRLPSRSSRTRSGRRG